MNRNPFGHLFFVFMFACMLAPVGNDSAAQDTPAKDKAQQVAKQDKPDQTKQKQDAKKWKVLKGKWSECQFGGDGAIEIKDKLIKLEMGDPITGIKWDGDVLRDNYEIEVEGRRVEGFDFFCAITFPVAKSHASLVLGGWGGGVVGISSIDDRDASDNDTTMFKDFKNGKWYKARVRVEETRIAVWIDDVLQFEHPRKDHKFDIRFEMDPCVPLGLANYQCESEFRVFRVRPLAKEELGIDLSKVSKKKPTDDVDEKSKP